LLPAVDAEIGARRLAKVRAPRKAARKDRPRATRVTKQSKPEPTLDPE
jgi:hypothetical protein